MTKAESFAMQYGYYDKEKKRACCVGYNAGYKQAEKDLALTWEDIRKIVVLFSEVSFECFDTKSANEMCEETLTRFKQYKEAKQ